MKKRNRKFDDSPGLTPVIMRLTRYCYGMSIEQVARKIGRSPAHVSNLENGKTKIAGTNAETAFKEYFGLTDNKIKRLKILYTKLTNPQIME